MKDRKDGSIQGCTKTEAIGNLMLLFSCKWLWPLINVTQNLFSNLITKIKIFLLEKWGREGRITVPNPLDVYANLSQFLRWIHMVVGTSPRFSSSLVRHTLKCFFRFLTYTTNQAPSSVLLWTWYKPGVTMGLATSGAHIKLHLNHLGQLEPEVESHIPFLKLHHI